MSQLIKIIQDSQEHNQEIAYQTIEEYIAYIFKDINDLSNRNINTIIDRLNCYVAECNNLLEYDLYKIQFVATRTLHQNHFTTGIFIIEQEPGHWDRFKLLAVNLILLNKVGLID